MTNAEAKTKIKEMRRKRREWAALKLAARELRKIGKAESAAACDALAEKLLK